METKECAPRTAGRRLGSRKGAEFLEFTFCFLPLTAILLVLLNASWGIFVKSTFAYAVHQGVRRGIAIDGAQAQGTTLTAMVKGVVQANTLGLLAGDAGLSRIHVDFYRVSPSDPTRLTTVTQAGGGLMPGDIIQVSIQGYSLPALAARIYERGKAPDKAGAGISAVAADRIEPFSTMPAI